MLGWVARMPRGWGGRHPPPVPRQSPASPPPVPRQSPDTERREYGCDVRPWGAESLVLPIVPLYATHYKLVFTAFRVHGGDVVDWGLGSL
jgi:hypothetical protein